MRPGGAAEDGRERAPEDVLGIPAVSSAEILELLEAEVPGDLTDSEIAQLQEKQPGAESTNKQGHDRPARYLKLSPEEADRLRAALAQAYAFAEGARRGAEATAKIPDLLTYLPVEMSGRPFSTNMQIDGKPRGLTTSSVREGPDSPSKSVIAGNQRLTPKTRSALCCDSPTHPAPLMPLIRFPPLGGREGGVPFRSSPRGAHGTERRVPITKADCRPIDLRVRSHDGRSGAIDRDGPRGSGLDPETGADARPVR